MGKKSGAATGGQGGEDGGANLESLGEFEAGLGSRTAIEDAGKEFLEGVAKGVKGGADAGDDGDAGDDDELEAGDGDELEDGDGEGDGEEGDGEEGEAEGKEAASKKDDDGEDDDDAEEEEEGDGKKKALVFVVKGHEERGESDIEIEVDDPETLERLRRLEADGMRGKEYRSRTKQLAEREADLADAELVIEHAPLKFVLDTMVPERRLEMAKVLLAEHWDDLLPTIDEYVEDRSKPSRDQLEARKKGDKEEKELARVRASTERARELRLAIDEMLPDGLAPETHARFLRDAQRDILDAVQRGERVSPADLPKLLKERIRLYGFAQGTKGRSGKPSTVARPASSRASAIADRKAAAQREQERIKRVQATRRNGKAVVPGGRGSAATVRKVVADSASIEEAGDALLKSGKASSWETLNPRK